MDENAASAGGVHETHVDRVDFVADFPGGSGAGDGKAGFSED